MRRPPAQLDASALYAKAVGALARRDRSETELRRLLAPRAAEAGDVDGVLERLREQGYLNDARVARTAAAYHHDVHYHGRSRALRDLRARGIAPELAADAVTETYQPAGGDADDRQAGEDALLASYIRKKRLKRPEDIRQAGNLFRRLLNAGFSPAAARRGLRAWQLNPDWLESIEAAFEDIEP